MWTGYEGSIKISWQPGLCLLHLKKTWHCERTVCWVSGLFLPRVTHNQAGHFPSAGCTTVMFLMLHFLSAGSVRVWFQGELPFSVPEKKEVRGRRENPPRSLLVSLHWSQWVPDKPETGSISRWLSGAPCFLNACETDISRGRCCLTFQYYLRGILFSSLISLSVMGLLWFLPDICYGWTGRLADRAKLSQIL